MRIAVLTPLPPARTGIAHYASMLLPALAKSADVTAVATDGDVSTRAFRSIRYADYRRDDYDVAVYQLGNNPFHETIYREALERPGIAVLHDAILHHLIVEMTLARGDAAAYIDALERNHGVPGKAWAEARAAGMHAEIGNFLFPASVELANRSRAVIVHNQFAADWLRRGGVTSPVHVVAHPYEAEAEPADRDAIRARLGITPSDRVIGLFGFLTSAKRGEVVVEAFRRARSRDASLKLLIVGEPAPNIDMSAIEGEGVITTGYVGDDEFGAYYAASDRFVNLRYPSAGETSGTLIRALASGKPVAVSAYAQFAEFPDDCVVRIPFGPTEIEDLVRFMTMDLPLERIAAAQRAWLSTRATTEAVAAAYLLAIRDTSARTPAQPSLRTLPLFPSLEISDVASSDAIAFTVTNRGDSVLRTRSYGSPSYRLIAKLSTASGDVADRWLEFDRDLGPGESSAVVWNPAVPAGTYELRFEHGAEGLPQVDTRAWYRAEVTLVR